MMRGSKKKKMKRLNKRNELKQEVLMQPVDIKAEDAGVQHSCSLELLSNISFRRTLEIFQYAVWTKHANRVIK